MSDAHSVRVFVASDVRVYREGVSRLLRRKTVLISLAPRVRPSLRPGFVTGRNLTSS
jgi:hypothetical protein